PATQQNAIVAAEEGDVAEVQLEVGGRLLDGKRRGEGEPAGGIGGDAEIRGQPNASCAQRPHRGPARGSLSLLSAFEHDVLSLLVVKCTQARGETSQTTRRTTRRSPRIIRIGGRKKRLKIASERHNTWRN